MSKLHRKSASGVGAAVVFVLLILAVVFLVFIVKLTSREAPTIALQNQPRGLGQRAELVVNASDARHNLKKVTLEVEQNGQVIHQSSLVIPAKPHSLLEVLVFRPCQRHLLECFGGKGSDS